MIIKMKITLLKRNFMKEVHKKNSSAKMLRLALMMLLFIPVSLFAQTDTTTNQEAKTVEEPALIAPGLDLITLQKSDNSIDLKAALSAKVKGNFIKLPLLKVTFIQTIGDVEKELGFVITDKFGKAIFTLKGDSIKTDAEGKLNFKAVFAGNKQMDPAEGEVSIKRARLEITPVKEDSLLSVQVKLIDIGTGTETAVPETVVGIYVHRFFNPLKLGEGTTDASGEATVEFPNNLPGNAKGNITLMAMLLENETYGNLETSVAQKWGVPVSDKLNELPRALWSPHPPLWMLITFIIMVVVVWGHYLVIIIQLFRLRKEEPASNATTI